MKNTGLKLAAIYNVFDGVELLVGSMRCIKEHVDLYIIVFQDVSNFGEMYNPLADLPVDEMDEEFNILWLKYEPGIVGMMDEKRKRNNGINAARHAGCTHFILMDCDEYYHPQSFEANLNQFLASGVDGSFASIWTYFRSPELRQENLDDYYVPFVHTLKEKTVTGHDFYLAYVDPTRRINCDYTLAVSAPMHHFSWVRHNIERKVRNSSARENINNSSLMQDWRDAKEGSIVNGGNKLVKVPDHFGINKMLSDFALKVK